MHTCDEELATFFFPCSCIQQTRMVIWLLLVHLITKDPKAPRSRAHHLSALYNKPNIAERARL